MSRSPWMCITVILACSRPSAVDRPSAQPPPASLVDATTVTQCDVRRSCGMSHPGLGSFSRDTTLYLGSCTRTRSSTSSSEVGPTDSLPKPAPVAAADCERLKALVVAVTADDVKHEEEIPAVDTPSCTLTVTCRPDTAPKISVQRQSASGSGHVAQLIDALERLP